MLFVVSDTVEQQQKGRSNRKKAGKGKKRSSKPHAKEALMFQALQNLTGGYYKVGYMQLREKPSAL